MQNFSFSEYLIIGLVLLLFGKDYLPAFLSRFLGIKMNGNGNGYQKQIDELHEHAKTSNEEVGKIQEDIETIKIDVGIIKGLLEHGKI